MERLFWYLGQAWLSELNFCCDGVYHKMVPCWWSEKNLLHQCCHFLHHYNEVLHCQQNLGTKNLHDQSYGKKLELYCMFCLYVGWKLFPVLVTSLCHKFVMSVLIFWYGVPSDTRWLWLSFQIKHCFINYWCENNFLKVCSNFLH